MKEEDWPLNFTEEVVYEPSDLILTHRTDSSDLGIIFKVKSDYTFIVYQHGLALYNPQNHLVRCQRFAVDLGARFCVSAPNKIFVIGLSSIVVISDPFLFDYKVIYYPIELPVPTQGTIWNHSLVFSTHSGIYRLNNNLTISRIITADHVSSIAASPDGSLVFCEHIKGHILFPNYKLYHLKNGIVHLITKDYFSYFNCIYIGDDSIAASSSDKITIYYNVISRKVKKKFNRTIYPEHFVIKDKSYFSLTPYGSSTFHMESYSCKHTPSSISYFLDIETEPSDEALKIIK